MSTPKIIAALVTVIGTLVIAACLAIKAFQIGPIVGTIVATLFVMIGVIGACKLLSE